MNNEITLIGKVLTDFKFDHSFYGEDFYEIKIGVVRESGTMDELNLTVSDRIVDISRNLVGKYVSVYGEIRTYNIGNDNDRHLKVTVFAMSLLELNDDDAYIIGENSVYISGTICKKNPMRITPLGRQITDIIVAVNRNYGKSDYLPCICWSRNAKFVDELEVGTKVNIWGRLQSRDYIKSDGTMHTAYELSVQNIEIKKEEIINEAV